MPDPSPFETTADGLRVRVRVTPRASADRARGIAADENGVGWLQVSVTAVPEDGRANKAVLKLLSKAWRLPKSAIEITAGATDRRKTLLLKGDAATLAGTLAGWIETLEH
jgi:uncharacterized protein